MLASISNMNEEYIPYQLIFSFLMNVCNYFKEKYGWKNLSQEFRLKNGLMNKKHKKVFKPLNYIEHLLILGSVVTGCVYYFYFCFSSCYSNS